MALDQDIQEELAQQAKEAYEEALDNGASPEEARQQALEFIEQQVISQGGDALDIAAIRQNSGEEAFMLSTDNARDKVLLQELSSATASKAYQEAIENGKNSREAKEFAAEKTNEQLNEMLDDGGTREAINRAIFEADVFDTDVHFDFDQAINKALTQHLGDFDIEGLGVMFQGSANGEAFDGAELFSEPDDDQEQVLDQFEQTGENFGQERGFERQIVELIDLERVEPPDPEIDLDTGCRVSTDICCNVHSSLDFSTATVANVATLTQNFVTPISCSGSICMTGGSADDTLTACHAGDPAVTACQQLCCYCVVIDGGAGDDTLSYQNEVANLTSNLCCLKHTNNSTCISGGEGNDTLNHRVGLDLAGSVCCSNLIYCCNSLTMDGGNGDDTICTLFKNSAINIACKSTKMELCKNDYTYCGGAGEDCIHFCVDFDSAKSDCAGCFYYHACSTITMDGAAGCDILCYDISQNSCGPTAVCNVCGNTLCFNGGDNCDTLSISEVFVQNACTTGCVGGCNNGGPSKSTYHLQGGDGEDTLLHTFTHCVQHVCGCNHYCSKLCYDGGDCNDTITMNFYSQDDADRHFTDCARLCGCTAQFGCIDIDQIGGGGNDTMTLSTTAMSCYGTVRNFTFNNIDFTGGDGTDIICTSIISNACKSICSACCNTIGLCGDAGDDCIWFNHTLDTRGGCASCVSDSQICGWSKNSVTLDGGAGADCLYYCTQINSATGSCSYTVEEFCCNTHSLCGGAGNDCLVANTSIQNANLCASCGIDGLNSFSTSHYVGGDGNDTICVEECTSNICMICCMQGSVMCADGGLGDDTVIVCTDYDGAQFVSSTKNAISLIGCCGVDTLCLTLDYNCSGLQDMNQSLFHQTGGADNDTLTLCYCWQNSDVGGACCVYDNLFCLDGGDGVDTLTACLKLYGTNAQNERNSVHLVGGAGNDILTVAYDATCCATDYVVACGGAGSDTINVGTVCGVIAAYGSAAEGGDTICGTVDLAGFDLRFASSFSGDANGDGALDGAGNFVCGAGCATATDADDYFIYDSTANKLYYDADGSGVGSSACLMATFDSATALTNADITFVYDATSTTCCATSGSAVTAQGCYGSDTLTTTFDSTSNAYCSATMTNRGGEGNDTLTLLSCGSGDCYEASTLCFIGDGGLGNDTVAFCAQASLTTAPTDTEVACFNCSSITLTGGFGNDVLKSCFDMSSTSASGAVGVEPEVILNTINMDGGFGDDTYCLGSTLTYTHDTAGAAGPCYTCNVVAINDILGATSICEVHTLAACCTCGTEVMFNNNTSCYNTVNSADTIVSNVAVSSASGTVRCVTGNKHYLYTCAGDDTICMFDTISAANGSVCSYSGNCGVVWTGDGNDTVCDTTTITSACINDISNNKHCYYLGDGDDTFCFGKSYCISDDVGTFSLEQVCVQSGIGNDTVSISSDFHAGDQLASTICQLCNAINTCDGNDSVTFTRCVDALTCINGLSRNFTNIETGLGNDTVVVNEVWAGCNDATSMGAFFCNYNNLSVGCGDDTLTFHRKLNSVASEGTNEINTYLCQQTYLCGGEGSDTVTYCSELNDVTKICYFQSSMAYLTDCCGSSTLTLCEDLNDIDSIVSFYCNCYLACNSDGMGCTSTITNSFDADVDSICVFNYNKFTVGSNAGNASTTSTLTANITDDPGQVTNCFTDNCFIICEMSHWGTQSNVDTMTMNWAGGADTKFCTNSFCMDGGVCNDTLSMCLNYVQASTTTFANNCICLKGGAGDDTMLLCLQGVWDTSTCVELFGGDGADTMCVSGQAAAYAGGEAIVCYCCTSELGDTICGFSNATEFELYFCNSNFNGDNGAGGTGALDAGYFVAGTAAADANDYFIYDAASFKLYYDADGSGTTETQQVVATFDSDVSLAADDINTV
ncbi:hypothetical protein [Magnetococcus sp. PR-3]|uniref:hypothetical protein n=1 Tax=Magnetococcus sp. PR-3 TaxID=3120355 RepID=UPI002FCE1371